MVHCTSQQSTKLQTALWHWAVEDFRQYGAVKGCTVLQRDVLCCKRIYCVVKGGTCSAVQMAWHLNTQHLNSSVLVLCCTYLDILHCIPYSEHCTVYLTVHTALYTLQCTLHCILQTVVYSWGADCWSARSQDGTHPSVKRNLSTALQCNDLFCTVHRNAKECTVL